MRRLAWRPGACSLPPPTPCAPASRALGDSSALTGLGSTDNLAQHQHLIEPSQPPFEIGFTISPKQMVKLWVGALK